MNKIIKFDSEWYTALVDECEAIMVEKSKIVREEVLEMYMMLGARILEEANKMPISRLVDAVSEDIGIGKTNLWKAVAVVKKYGSDPNKLPIEGASLSWNKAKNLVTAPTEVSTEVVCRHKDFYILKICRICGYRETIEDSRKP
jgi:hypothetical protein